MFGLGALSLLATALAGPVSQWIGRAPEIGAIIQQKLSVLDQPLAALHELEGSLFGGSNTGFGVSAPSVVLPVVAFLTPAAGELLLFFVTLYFFLVGQIELRNQAVTMFANRDSKLRFLEDHARHRAQSRRLSHGGDDHQCRGRHHRRRRRLARRLAQARRFSDYWRLC